MFRSLSSDCQALKYLPFLRYHRGLSGQNHVPMTRGTAGIKAEPNCSLHEMSPVFPTARLEQVPRKIPSRGVSYDFGALPVRGAPKAVQICQDMTKPPRIIAGEFSAEKTGTVTSLRPIPMPSSMLFDQSVAGSVTKGMFRLTDTQPAVPRFARRPCRKAQEVKRWPQQK